VITDPVDDWCARAPRVVQVGQAVGEAGPEVQQRRGGPSRDAAPPVGGAGADTLEQPEHDTHAGDAVERRDNWHLGGARIREAHLDARMQGGVDQAKCTCAHRIASSKDTVPPIPSAPDGMSPAGSRLMQPLPLTAPATALRCSAPHSLGHAATLLPVGRFGDIPRPAFAAERSFSCDRYRCGCRASPSFARGPRVVTALAQVNRRTSCRQSLYDFRTLRMGRLLGTERIQRRPSHRYRVCSLHISIASTELLVRHQHPNSSERSL